MTEFNINNIPYAAWLEKNIKDLITSPVKSICVSAVSTDGDVYRDYYNADMLDKITMAGVIQQDAMLDSMAAHGIIEYEDDEEGDADGEEKE